MMAGIFPDYYFDNPGATGGMLPPWFDDAVKAMEQGGLPMLTGEPYGGFPMQPAQQPPEQVQIPAAAPPTVGAMAQPTGGMMPSALNNLPVPSLPALSLPPLSAIGDRLNAGLMGFAHGGAPLPAIANLISGLVTGQRADPQGVALAQQDRAQRAAAEYVAGAQDIEPNLKAAIIANPALAAQYLLARVRPRANPFAPRLRAQ
jgi:hypothetical protein